MATKFYRRTTPEYTIMPNATYADLFDNNKTTTDIQSGTVGVTQTTSLFVGDYVTAAMPIYGGGELVGAKVGLYINTITAGQAGGSAGLKAFKLEIPIGNREGGKDSAGSIVTNSNITQFSAFHTRDSSVYINENFSGIGVIAKDVVETARNAVVVQHIGPYLSQADGYKYGRNFTPDYSDNETVSANTHHNRYGQTLADGTKIYKLEHDLQWGNSGWKSIKEKKLWWYRNNEWWSLNDVGGTNSKDMAMINSHGSSLVKFSREHTIEIPPDDKVQTINTNNSFFEIIHNAKTFRGTKTDITTDITTHTREAYSNLTFTSNNVLTGGYALHLDSLYMHRTNSTSRPWYPRMKAANGSDIKHSALQQTSFASKIVPMPVEVGNSNKKDKLSAGGHSPIPTIEIDINFEEMAPMLVRFENAASALGGARTANATGDDTGCPWRYRLNRSIAVTFGSQAPEESDSLFMYVKKHCPSAGGAGDKTEDSDETSHFNPTWTKNGLTQPSVGIAGNGDLATAESFFGTAFVNFDGNLCYYNLDAYRSLYTGYYNTTKDTHVHSSPYDDLSFRADDALGEICFMNQPHIIKKSYAGINRSAEFNSWMRLAFQVDPELMGAAYTIYDPKQGDILKTPDILTNVKPYSQSGDARKMKVPNRDDWPKYMTIWINNYQAVKGKFNANWNNYETGLVFAFNDDAGGDRANPRLVQANAHASEIQDGAQLTSVPFHLVKPGTSCRHSRSDGGYTVSSEIGVTDHNPALNGDGFLIINMDEDDKSYEKGDPLLYDQQYCVDSQITSAAEDMRISAFIDAITFKNFNIIHQNTTPNENNTVPKRLEIPAIAEIIPFAYALGNGIPSNVYASAAYANSYLCFGFDNYTDLGFAENISSASSDTNVLMNEYKVNNSSTTETIITNIHSDVSHVRAGYSSSVEDYGIQCREKMTQTFGNTGTQGVNGTNIGAENQYAGYLIDHEASPNLSPFFDNNHGTPRYADRGLKVGNDTTGFELSIGSDEVRQIDRFTQKGLLTWNFNARTSDSTADTPVSTQGSGVTSLTFTARTTGSFSANQHIKIVDEVMKVVSVDTSTTVTVLRGQYGTTAVTVPANTNIFDIAVPEKRECLYTSCRVLHVEDKTTLIVDEPSIFHLPDDTEYIIYKHGDSHSAPTSEPRIVKCVRRTENTVYFNKPHGIGTGVGKFDMMISPKKFWLVLELTNIGGEVTKTCTVSGSGINTSVVVSDTDGISTYMTVKGTSTYIWNISGNTLTLSADYTGSTITLEPTVTRGNNQNITKTLLPNKSYQNVIGITTDTINLGATFKESLYNDGTYINNWNLEGFEDSDESVVTLKDYGFGDYDEEKESGGHAGYIGLNILNDTSKYKEIDISGVIEQDSVESSSVVPILISTDNPQESFKINIDTETGTNPTYLLSVFEDELLDKPELSVAPDKDNEFYPKFKWTLADKDAWYGFIMVDDKNIESQYSNAVIHYPLNESGSHGTSASAPIEKISGITTISGPNCTITITDYTELNTGDKVNLIATDGTNYDFTNGDQSSVAGTWESTTSNDVTATNLMNVINTSSGLSGTRFTATVDGAVVTATQATGGIAGNTVVTLTDSGTAGMTKTDFDRGPLYDIEGLAGYSLRFDGTNDFVKCGAGNNDPTSTATTEMSIVAHLIPDAAGSDDRYIIAQEETGGRKFSIKLNSSNQVVARVYDGEASHIELVSSVVVPTNSEIPTVIILTVDTKLKSGNVKLFVNGKLEDITGIALETGTVNNWETDAAMQSANGYVIIGNSSHSLVNLGKAFDGKLEEVVIYNKCLYPVIPTALEFLLTKPISELVSGQTLAQSKSNTAKIFIKDYHNIRGSTEQEVASSSQVSWRKAAFALDTS